ncbi:MAG: PEGA domain-containing protein [Candidatus Eisenbacteria bacterium]|nr:PEGA domain-containing protein [Candidatus Eisenbacteria bacterium]
MNVEAVPATRWSVSTRMDGEVLTVWTGGDDLQLGLFAEPGSFTVLEYEGWLNDLLGVAHETASDDSRPSPIHALLHQALTGLLFSHSELWERAGGPHGSMALVAADGQVGFGWVGEAAVELRLDDRSTDVAWVSIRDSEAREARAICFDASRHVRIALVWRPHPGSPVGAMLDAEWRGAAGASDPVGSAGEAAIPERHADVSARSEAAASAPTDWAHSPEEATHGAGIGTLHGAGIGTLHGAGIGTPHGAAIGTPHGAGSGASHGAGIAVTRAADSRGPLVISSNRPDPTGEPSPPRGPGTLTRIWNRLSALWRHRPQAPRSPAKEMPAPVLRVPEPEARMADPLDPHLLPLAPMDRIVVLRAPVLKTPGPAMDPVQDPGRRPIIDGASPERPSLAPPPAIGPERIERTAPHMPAHGDPIESALPIDEPPPAIEQAAGSPAPPPDVAAADSAPIARSPLRPRWPSPAEFAAPTPLRRRPWPWFLALVVLFGGGYLAGTLQTGTGRGSPSRSIAGVLRAIGLGGSRFAVAIGSRPSGAWITVDGKDLAQRTPASLELKPGTHQVSLSFTDLGATTFPVRGVRGDHVALDEPLWGSLVIEQLDPSVPVSIEVDGQPLGFIPVSLDSVMPGAHEIRFSGPGMTPWAQTVEVRVRQEARVVARPMTSPSTGVMVVRATVDDEQGSTSLNGGEVWIDGESRGRTPLTLELPRGPHSVRVVLRGESSAVEVIDLPGGNQRFANLQLGLLSDRQKLVPVGIAERISPEHPAVVSAALDGLHVSDVREMWLHVEDADGAWRRYALDVMKSPAGVVGVIVFPTGVFDAQGRTRYYLSALTTTGDEYFTEMAKAWLAGKPASSSRGTASAGAGH